MTILVDIRACRVRKDRPFTTIVDKLNSQFILYLRPLRTNLIGNEDTSCSRSWTVPGQSAESLARGPGLLIENLLS